MQIGGSRSSSGEQQNYWLTIRFIAPTDRSVVSGSAASTRSSRLLCA
jgi:hypothetical protein